MSEFKTIIKDIRIKRKLTQKQMAELIGTSERYYQEYEAGKIEPNMETVRRIVNALDVSADYLMGLSDNPKR